MTWCPEDANKILLDIRGEMVCNRTVREALATATRGKKACERVRRQSLSVAGAEEIKIALEAMRIARRAKESRQQHEEYTGNTYERPQEIRLHAGSS